MGRKLLLVEDDLVIASMLTAALRRWGYEVLFAADGRRAIEVAKSAGTEVGAILCDVVLTDGSATTAARELRRWCPSARIVFTSGFPVDMLHDRGMLSQEILSELNATYLAKPFLPRDVHAAVADALDTDCRPRRACAGFSH